MPAATLPAILRSTLSRVSNESLTGELSFENEIIVPVATRDFLLLAMDLLLKFVVVLLLIL